MPESPIACVLAEYWRREFDLSKAELARRCGWNDQKIIRILSGEQDPKGDDIATIATAFGLSLAEFSAAEAHVTP